VDPAEWDALALRSGSVFATREWSSTWQRHEEADRDVHLLTSRRADGSLAGLLPVVTERRFPHLLRPAGPWPPSDDSVICAAQDREWVTRDLLRRIPAAPGGDVLRLQVGVEEHPRGRGAAVEIETVSDRTILLQGTTWEELLAESGRNSRRAFQRRTRRLHETYAVTYRRTEDPAALERDIDLFLQLHWNRWGDEVFLLTEERRPFLLDFATQALRLGWLSLWFLELDGTAVAAQLSFRFAGAETAFMPGIDPAFREEQAGIALLYHTLQVAIEEGMERLHLGPGDEPYKDRLPNVDHRVKRLLVPVSPLGAASLQAWRVGRGARDVAARARTSLRRREDTPTAPAASAEPPGEG
jgi:CelD/BcsL family acetyltransferase involved in cellulose biosynthesis